MSRSRLFWPGAALSTLLFLLASGLLGLRPSTRPEPYYYGFAAFLAGFSERFATVMFGAAEQRLAPGDEHDEGAPGARRGTKTGAREESPV